MQWHLHRDFRHLNQFTQFFANFSVVWSWTQPLNSVFFCQNLTAQSQTWAIMQLCRLFLANPVPVLPQWNYLKCIFVNCISLESVMSTRSDCYNLLLMLLQWTIQYLHCSVCYSVIWQLLIKFGSVLHEHGSDVNYCCLAGYEKVWRSEKYRDWTERARIISWRSRPWNALASM